MNLAVLAFSRRGLETAVRAAAALAGPEDACRTFAPARLAEGDVLPIQGSLPDFTGPLFRWADCLVFVGACGIAVRAVAPHVRDKLTDPAVLAVDERAGFVIPLLSGHVGGANALALRLAAALGAQAAVTTATDVNGRFSPDAWAARQGLFLDNRETARAVSAAILEGDVPLRSDFPIAAPLPPGVVLGGDGPAGICISWRRQRPFDATLLLVPRVVRLGIGCRRGTAAAVIGQAVDQALAAGGIHPAAVAGAASIDVKRDEPGLLALCRQRGWETAFYSAARLAAVAGDFTPSDFVRQTVGVDNVCERAAMVTGEKLLMRKTAAGGVTVAAAAEHWEVRFG